MMTTSTCAIAVPPTVAARARVPAVSVVGEVHLKAQLPVLHEPAATTPASLLRVAATVVLPAQVRSHTVPSAFLRRR